ncbi:tyrosine-type recombinase/integrase [candidate division KSB1 bacterium]
MAVIRPVRLKRRGNFFQLHYYSLSGRLRRISAGNSEVYANRLVARFADWLLDGKDPEVELRKAKRRAEQSRITVAQLFDRFMRDHVSLLSESYKTMCHERYKQIKRCKEIVDAQIGEITKSIVLGYRNYRVQHDGVSNGTANRDVALLKSMFSKAVEWEYLDYNPIKEIKNLKEREPRRVDHVTPEQIMALLELLPVPVTSYAELAWYTGFRANEILGMRIEDVRFYPMPQDSVYGEVVIKKKGSKWETFPLSKNAIQLLRRVIDQRAEGYVFISPKTGTRYVEVSDSFTRAVKKLGLTARVEDEEKPFVFHDIRRWVTTFLRRKGVEIRSISEVVGHSDEAITASRYISPDRMKQGKILGHIPSFRAVEDQKNPGMTIIKTGT